MLINGQPADKLPLADRGLAYGDGLFETIRINEGRLVLGSGHLARLQNGCDRLQLVLDRKALDAEIAALLGATTNGSGILKIIVTRGSSGRGYRPAAGAGTRILTLHPLPEFQAGQREHGIRAFVCKLRLGLQPVLAGLKHLNRLEQVLASLEWPDESFQEGLMLDTAGNVIEGTRSNVFIATDTALLTPSLEQCGVAGVLREALLQHFGATAEIARITLRQLETAREVFFCNSVAGVWPLHSLLTEEGERHWQPGPRALEAQRVFDEALHQ